ncbi:MAG: hypothetical protein ACOY3X_10255 [Pseudomonadota bacterium]
MLCLRNPLPLALCLTLIAQAHAQEATPPPVPAITNPRISLILDGVAYADDIGGAGNTLTGEAAGIVHSHEHGHDDEGHGAIEEGFNLREAEVVMSATVDTLFDAYANLAFGTGDVELEEAWFSTRALPAGWQLKAGKFFSAFGYANSKHPHSRDFADQDLAYLSLIGDHGLNDTGVQLTWSPATDSFLQIGVEALQGHEQEKFGTAIDLDDIAGELNELDNVTYPDTDPEALGLPGVDRRGPQIHTAFAKWAPDLGTDHALQLGLSAARHKSHQEAHEEGDPVTDIFYTEGEATLLGLEAVYKRTATGRNGDGSLRVSAEYLRLETDTEILFHTTPAEIGESVTGEQDALYVQGIYGFAPRWEAGLRYDATGMTSRVSEGGTTTGLADSSRLAAVLTFRPSEYSCLRLQAAHADIADDSGGSEAFTQVMLQYSLSLGAHGAHAF